MPMIEVLGGSQIESVGVQCITTFPHDHGRWGVRISYKSRDFNLITREPMDLEQAILAARSVAKSVNAENQKDRDAVLLDSAEMISKSVRDAMALPVNKEGE